MNKKLIAIFSICLGLIGTRAESATPYRQVSGPNMYGNTYSGYSTSAQYGSPVYSPVVGTNSITPTQYQTVSQINSSNRSSGTYNPYSNRAGAKYYSAQSFDKLVDSGVYLGLSVAYGTPTGKMKSDYDDPFIPGASESSKLDKSTFMPLGVSIGAAVNNDVRLDFSYTRYSGLSYPDNVKFNDAYRQIVNLAADGGKITAQATMLNLYYSLESYTGNLFGGKLVPYIGVGLGISVNTIADYTVSYRADYALSGGIPIGTNSEYTADTAIWDMTAYHAGGTTENFAYAGELGLTASMSGGLMVDFFVRYADLGKVESSGTVFESDLEQYFSSGTDAANILFDESAFIAEGYTDGAYTSNYIYSDNKESADLTSVDVGVRLRVQF